MLQIRWTTDEPPAHGQTLVVPLGESEDPASLETRFGAAIRQAVADAPFRSKPGESFTFTRERGGRFERVILLGVGSGLVEPKDLRTFAHLAARQANGVGTKHLVIDLRRVGAPWSEPKHAVSLGDLVAQGLELGTYRYDRFLSEDKRTKQSLREVTVWSASEAPSEGTRRGQIVAASIARARDLGNGPPGYVTPTFLAETARTIVDERKDTADVSVDILDRDECAKLGMGCFLGVAQGSDEPPKFIHLRYMPKGKSRGRVCLIGKGVTFDSGGYSLKPSDAMFDMKLDMAGAAAVMGAFTGLVDLGVDWEVHVLVAATENLVSGRAYKLGDVLTASNGKTVEINNTDAEGRLTMADALVYASKLEPDFVIDFATLTGACIVALGPKIAGVMTGDEALYADWSAAAKRTGEPMWRLPLPDDLEEQLESKVADMKNTGERAGGALTAGLFLRSFCEGRRWMHVDIAGPAMASKAYGTTTPGGTGFPVATIIELLASPS
jgi:leucyl aminopeptidase